MDRSHHTATKNINDERRYAVFTSKLFKKVNYVKNALDEVELAKKEIEHRKPISFGIFNLQSAKLGTL